MLIPDALTDALQTLRLQNTHSGYFKFTSPWGMRIPNDNDKEVAYHIVLKGECWLLIDGESIHLTCGDLVILLQRVEHIICDRPSSKVVNLDEVIEIEPNQGYKQIAYGGGGIATELVSGCFELLGDRLHNPLLLALPPLLHIKNDRSLLVPWLENTLGFIAAEIAIGQLGCQTVVARSMDILFIQAVRAYVNSLGTECGNWLSALIDREIGMTLSLIHRSPEYPWTVAALAEKIAMSRSAFAARFTQLVGQPPLQYLTNWRMVKGADLLRESQLGIRAIGLQVGYESEVSFSKAFKRWAGIAPSFYRQQAANRSIEKITIDRDYG